MERYGGNIRSMLSMAFHALFGALWLMVLPGIIVACFVMDRLALVPAFVLLFLLIFHKRTADVLGNIKDQAVSFTERYPLPVIAAFFMLLQIVLQIYTGYEMAVTPSGDRNIIFNQAAEMALNNVFKTSDEYNFYFLRYPNNVLLLMLEAVWFMLLKAMGAGSFLYGNMLLNIFAIDLSIILCMVIVYRKYGKNTAVLFQVMTLFFVPFYTYVPFVYTDTLVLPVVAGILLCYQVLEECWDKKGPGFYLILVLMGILTWAGFGLKPTAVIITVACFIHMVFSKGWKRGTVAALIIVLSAGICVKTYNIVMDKMEVVDQTDYDKENFPYSHWIMMGLQGTGNYSLKDRKYTSSFETKKEKEKGNIAMIKKRLEDYGVAGFLLHQYVKAVSTWSNGKYDMEYHLQQKPERNSWLQEFFFKDGRFYPLYDVYCTLYQFLMLFFIAASVIYGFIKRETGSPVMWKLALFGLFLFLSLWETKSRYVLHFIPVMLLITTDMIVKIKNNFGRKGITVKRPEEISMAR